MGRTTPQVRATIDDLDRVEGSAELIDGRIVKYMPTGHRPGKTAFRIARRLDDYAEEHGLGDVNADGVGFVVPELSSGRESFCPDGSLFGGELPVNDMRFVDGPPTFAVGVRSEGDYGPAADREHAAKRADYFEAGTLVVWDVDPIAEEIRSYRLDRPDEPTRFVRGQVADAEPAVPCWRVPVDEVSPPRR